MNRLSFVATILLVTSTSPSVAGSYIAFRDFRVSDATGRYYLVVKKLPGNPSDPGRGTSVEFAYVECNPAASPVKFVEDEAAGYGMVKKNPEVRVRDGDKVLGSGKLERSPRLILISSTGLGFVGLDVRGYNYGDLQSGKSVVVVASDGSMRHGKSLVDLFSPREIESFTETAGGISWLHDGWIDEKRREAVVIGSRPWHDDDGEGKPKPLKPRLVRVVNMESGAVRKGSHAEVITAVTERNLGGIDGALDLVLEEKIASAKEHLPRLFDDRALPLPTRLRAAVALSTFGDRRGRALMTKAALNGGDAMDYALDHLVEVLGDDAAPVLCDAVQKHGEKASHSAWMSMQKVGAKAAVPQLIRLVNDRSKPQGIEFALECLGDKKAAAKEAVPHLIRMLQEKLSTETPEYTVLRIVETLGEIGPYAEEAIVHLRKVEKAARERVNKLKAENYKPPENLFKNQLWIAEKTAESTENAIRAIENKPEPTSN
jgi:hypothetical protein